MQDILARRRRIEGMGLDVLRETTREENRELMSRLGITVWLDAPFDLCWRRIQNDGATRPLAPDELTANARYEGRLALYRQASIHIPINQSHSPDDISETIVGKLSQLLK